jgi:hypothetical protein
MLQNELSLEYQAYSQIFCRQTCVVPYNDSYTFPICFSAHIPNSDISERKEQTYTHICERQEMRVPGVTHKANIYLTVYEIGSEEIILNVITCQNRRNPKWN